MSPTRLSSLTSPCMVHSGIQGLLEQVEEAVGAISQLDTTRKGLAEAGKELESAALEATKVEGRLAALQKAYSTLAAEHKGVLEEKAKTEGEAWGMGHGA